MLKRWMMAALTVLCVCLLGAVCAEEPVFTAEAYLRPGELLTTVALYKAEGEDEEGIPLVRAVINGKDELTFGCVYDQYMMPLEFIDLDMDGTLDLKVHHIQGATNYRTSFYLWDESQGKLVAAPGTQNLVMASLTRYPDAKLLLTYGHNSASSGIYTLYAWRERALAKVGEIIIDNDENDMSVLIQRVIRYAEDGTETVLMDTRTKVENEADWTDRETLWMQLLFSGLNAGEPDAEISEPVYTTKGNAYWHRDAWCASLTAGGQPLVQYLTGDLGSPSLAALTPCPDCAADR